jgi:hypothetical protein
MRASKLLLATAVLVCFSWHGAQGQTASAKPGNAAEPIGHIWPKKPIEVPDKKTAAFPKPAGNARYPLLGKKKVGNTDYYLLLLEDVSGAKRPALVPSFDARGNPSAEEHVDYVIMDHTAGLKAYLGFYLLKAGQKYPVVSSANGKHVVRYTSYGCDALIDVEEADVTFMTVEQERTQQRALEEERLKHENEQKLAREKFEAEQKAKGLVLYRGAWVPAQQAAEAEKQRLQLEAQQQEAARVEFMAKLLPRPFNLQLGMEVGRPVPGDGFTMANVALDYARETVTVGSLSYVHNGIQYTLSGYGRLLFKMITVGNNVVLGWKEQPFVITANGRTFSFANSQDYMTRGLRLPPPTRP